MIHQADNSDVRPQCGSLNSIGLLRTVIHRLCRICEVTIVVLITKGSDIAEGPRDAVPVKITPAAKSYL